MLTKKIVLFTLRQIYLRKIVIKENSDQAKKASNGAYNKIEVLIKHASITGCGVSSDK